MFERFTKAARAVVVDAVAEAERRGDHRVGTQHLLLGVAGQRGTRAAGALGADLATARTALDDLDRAALASIGIDVPADEPVGEPGRGRRGGHRPFTAGAKAVLSRALVEAALTRSRSLEVDHLLLALVDAQPPDPVLDLMHRLGVSPVVVRERLRPAA
jgi:ATP-dependent Clp protease ATP-binding subunit ClpA